MSFCHMEPEACRIFSMTYVKYTLQTGVKIEAFIHFVIFMMWMNEQNGCYCNVM